MTQAQIQPTPDGAIVFDADAVAQASFDPDWFEPDYWRAQAAAESASGGRGGALFVAAPFGNCALRHYRRGGMVARVLGDRYLWAGAEATRSFAEFRLLQTLREKGLRAPQPLAARYRRHGIRYRADILMRRVENAATLAESIAQGNVDTAILSRTGAAIARFHAQGAYHADLNAHNVLLTPADVWLIDFDRGELRPLEWSWRRANLLRLKRSLEKINAAHGGDRAAIAAWWEPLMNAYLGELSRLVPGIRP